MDKLFQVPARIDKIETLADRTLKLRVYTSREISDEETATMLSLNQKEGWLLFKENEFQPTDIPKEEAEIKGLHKSLSERLYNVLFVYHSQNYSSSFEDWRRQEMENIINNYKSLLR